MYTGIKIGVIGGDLRQLAAAAKLAEDGYETAVFGFDEYEGSLGGVTRCVAMEDALRGSAAVVLPLPYSLDKIHLNTPLTQNDIHIDRLFSLFQKNQIIIGGKFDKIAEGLAESAEVKLHDYYLREEMTILNAVPAAEGAINIAMQELSVTLSDVKALILGYGRIGKILAHKLSALTKRIDVAARKTEDFAWIKAYGYEGVSYEKLEDTLPEYDVIFNTVPALLLDKDRLVKLKHGAVIIDLASKPGGVDFTSAKSLNINVVWALSLPGKYAPLTSGTALRDSIRHIMKEEGLT